MYPTFLVQKKTILTASFFTGRSLFSSAAAAAGAADRFTPFFAAAPPAAADAAGAAAAAAVLAAGVATFAANLKLVIVANTRSPEQGSVHT